VTSLFDDHLTPETREQAARGKVRPKRRKSGKTRPERVECALSIAGILSAEERDDVRLRNAVMAAVWSLGSDELAEVAELVRRLSKPPGFVRHSPPVRPPPDTGNGYDD
jgi:hypothetical protein